MAQLNDIRLPSWISPGMVFQQGVPIVLRGKVGSSKVPVTLEVMKDPTDGRKVSKLDTDYGVILSLETVSDEDGSFQFTMPAYRSSTDAYTLVFHSLTEQVTIEDCRCGDVWVMFGGKPFAASIAETAAPRTPLKKDVMPLLRFYSPKKGTLDEIDKFSYEPIFTVDDTKWIRIRDTKELASVSSVAFSYAYHLAEQLHYPVGIWQRSMPRSTAGSPTRASTVTTRSVSILKSGTSTSTKRDGARTLPVLPKRKMRSRQGTF